MALSNRKQKDQEMAARMKVLKIERTDLRCPMCHVVVAMVRLPARLSVCGGQEKTRK